MASFDDIYPELLERSVQEVGDLIGETLSLQKQADSSGTAAEVFSPPKNKFGLTRFDLKGGGGQPVQLLFSLELAIELAGRLIMLPADEIAACKKQGKIEGEVLDAFSEIANILSGVLNSTCYEAFARKDLHFVKGEVAVFAAKTSDLTLPEGRLSAFSGELVLNDKNLGVFQYFLPHSLLAAEAAADAEAPAEEAAAAEAPEPEAPSAAAAEAPKAPPAADKAEKAGAAPEAGAPAGTEPDEGKAAAETAEATPEAQPQQDGLLDQASVDEILLGGLDPAQEELEALLGDGVVFTEPQTDYRKKQDLLARTKGKQVLTRIRASGDRSGDAFMLLPLKDAIYFAAVLLMMPAESITQTVKQGKFEGDVADAFGEVANILVGCYSQQFKSAAPFNVKLKKDTVETLVAAQVDPAGDVPFNSEDYYQLAFRIQMGEKSYGPLELVFPLDLLGLAAPETSQAKAEAAGKAEKPAGDKMAPDNGKKPVPGQKSDTAAVAAQTPQGRVISIIGEDPAEFDLVAQSITEEDVRLNRLSLKDDFKQALAQADPSCVFLLINQVNDQGLAKAIKVRAALKQECPLIVAGPQWTESMVLKAKKYGATDILITPAGSETVRRKYRKYL